jgi:hypothetical protein
MEVKQVTVKNNLRKLKVSFGENTEITPQQAITTTNLNHSKDTDYKTGFLEIFVQSIDDLKTKKGYDKFMKFAVKRISENLDKYAVITPRGIKSRKLTPDEFKLLCNVQKDVGIKNIRLFFRFNLRKEINNLLTWVEKNIGSKYHYVLDHNLNIKDFMRLYLDAVEKKKHQAIYFISREPNKNNKNRFIFIQTRSDDKVLRWIFSLPKKAKSGAVKSVFYYVLGYDVASFTTKKGSYQVPKAVLEVIKDFRYVPASVCENDKCVIIEGNTLGQSIEQFARQKRDSIPCSAFSIVKINTEYEKFRDSMDTEKILLVVQEELKKFNEISE